MKKMMIALTVMLLTVATGKAMSYEQARNEALFLTDKMAYELNLTDDQYEAAYEINLDYLMGVTSYDDVYGVYWERRNQDLSYIMLDWQWNAFCAASYFFRPLYWRDGYWHFGVYARYPHRDYFFFGRPVFYASYRGGHAWHRVGGRGFYYTRREHFRPTNARTLFGLHDRWDRGDFRHNGKHQGQGKNHFGGTRTSSTRTTGHPNGREYGNGHHFDNGSNSHRYDNGSNNHRHDNGSNNRQYGDRGNNQHFGSGSIGQHEGNSGHTSRFGNSTTTGTTSQGGVGNRSSFGGSRNSGTLGGNSLRSGRNSSLQSSVTPLRTNGTTVFRGSSSAGSRSQSGNISSSGGRFGRGR